MYALWPFVYAIIIFINASFNDITRMHSTENNMAASGTYGGGHMYFSKKTFARLKTHIAIHWHGIHNAAFLFAFPDPCTVNADRFDNVVANLATFQLKV